MTAFFPAIMERCLMVVGIELRLSMGWKWSDLTLLNENFIKNIFGRPHGE
ncbi:hypothetical protein [Komagataeibacter saccharivorans]